MVDVATTVGTVKVQSPQVSEELELVTGSIFLLVVDVEVQSSQAWRVEVELVTGSTGLVLVLVEVQSSQAWRVEVEVVASATGRPVIKSVTCTSKVQLITHM